jgi:hypothetical protein
MRLLRRHLKRTQQRYFANLRNCIHAASRAFGFFTAPIVIVGNPKFASSMPHQRSAPTQRTLDELAKSFTVCVIDENNTSLVCPYCHCFLQQTSEWKLKRCSNAECRALCRDGVAGDAAVGGGGGGGGAGGGGGGGGGGVQRARRVLDRDLAATLNLLEIFMTLILTGWRPVVFRKGFSAFENLHVGDADLSAAEVARRRALASAGGRRVDDVSWQAPPPLPPPPLPPPAPLLPPQ